MAQDRMELLMDDGLEEEMEDGGLGFGEETSTSPHKLRKPFVGLFHVAFKTAAILVYLFSGLIGSGFVASFVTVIILLALDFWTVKNITGRLLVGYRWWNHIDNEGQSHWVFEGRKGTRRRSGGRPPEKRLFWTALLVAQGIWALFTFWTTFTFRFQWAILGVLANLLNGANLYGYVRCALGHQPGVADATGFLGQGLTSLLIQRATSGFQSTSTTQSQSNANNATTTNAFTQQV